MPESLAVASCPETFGAPANSLFPRPLRSVRTLVVPFRSGAPHSSDRGQPNDWPKLSDERSRGSTSPSIDESVGPIDATIWAASNDTCQAAPNSEGLLEARPRCGRPRLRGPLGSFPSANPGIPGPRRCRFDHATRSSPSLYFAIARGSFDRRSYSRSPVSPATPIPCHPTQRSSRGPYSR
jgi:hypothetical protein